MILSKRFSKGQKGQALVEFALILPIIILIFFGILESGRIFHSYIVITYAAREGARAGAVGKPDDVIEETIRGAAPLPQAETNLNITKLEPAKSARAPGLPLTVEVSYDMELFTPVFSDFLPNPVTLKSQVTMRLE